VEDGRAGARRAGHEPGLGDLLVDHTRVVAHVLRQLDPHLEEAQEEAPRHPAAHDGEVGLLLERR
jgi:hypothetical protein